MHRAHRAKTSSRKLTLVLALSLGSVVLGIGCVGWALMNIGAEQPAPDSHRSLSSNPATVSSTTTAPTQMDPLSNVVRAYGVLYPDLPSGGDRIGSLSIPVTKQKLPIFEGTGKEELKRGVGHFTESVLPGENDNCVISGHRDTVFTKLGKLKVHDRLIVETSAGAFTYEIKRIRIVHKDDRTVIVPTGHPVLTVTTCYPFHFVGSAPDRYILVADLVTSERLPCLIE